MNKLTIKLNDGQLVIDSREVAEMVGKRHSDLLGNIEVLVKYLANGKVRSQDFFIRHTYNDVQGKPRPCFLLTKKGCDMVANKMTGEKGTLFTAAYVTRFEELEKGNLQSKILSENEQLIAYMRLSLEMYKELEVLGKEVKDIKDKVENQITFNYSEQRILKHHIAIRVIQTAISVGHRRMLFSELHRGIKDLFGVISYKDVKQNELEYAVEYVEKWVPGKRNIG